MHPLGNFRDNYICPVAKIQASSLCVCTDSHLHRLYLYDISRPFLDALHNETSGYVKNDLVVASIDLRDPADGDAVCADICCDPDGYYIYALMISREGRGAWIKVFKHHNRQFEATGISYKIPEDTTPLQMVMRNDVRNTISNIPLYGHIGKPIIYQQLCYGAGIEFYNGFLYIITRRETNLEFITVAGYDVALWQPEPVVIEEEEPQEQEGEEGEAIEEEEEVEEKENRYSIRLYEKRVGQVQFNLLTILNATSGNCYGHRYLSYPETDKSTTKTDAVFQGITWIEDKLYSQIRFDHTVVSSNLLNWHLQEAKVSLPPELSTEVYDPATGRMVLPVIQSVIPVLQGKIPDPLPSTPAMLLKKVRRVIRRIQRIQSTATNNLPVPFQIKTIRGQTALVSFKSPLYSSSFTKEYPKNPRLAQSGLLSYQVVHNRFPWGISMAYSLSADSAEKKLYGVYGNQLWVYDMMEYTLMVRYPDGKGGYTFYEGDIIDLGNVALLNRTEIQCFIKNKSPYRMADVHLIIDLTTTKDPRAKELFLSYEQGEVGYKDLAVGSIAANGGSKEFWVEIHPQDIQPSEWFTSHTVPLKVVYTCKDDSF